jgi:hypothetical protein
VAQSDTGEHRLHAEYILQGCDPSTGTCVGCTSGQTCLNGSCCPNDQVCGTGTSVTCCPEGRVCVSGEWQCPTGTTLCGGNCVDPTCSSNQFFDPSNCTCVACLANGSSPCSDDTQCCSGRCLNTPGPSPGICCARLSSPCTSNSQCCSGVCATDGLCCGLIGSGCSTDLDCCSLHCGSGGQCVI